MPGRGSLANPTYLRPGPSHQSPLLGVPGEQNLLNLNLPYLVTYVPRSKKVRTSSGKSEFIFIFLDLGTKVVMYSSGPHTWFICVTFPLSLTSIPTSTPCVLFRMTRYCLEYHIHYKCMSSAESWHIVALCSYRQDWPSKIIFSSKILKNIAEHSFQITYLSIASECVITLKTQNRFSKYAPSSSIQNVFQPSGRISISDYKK